MSSSSRTLLVLALAAACSPAERPAADTAAVAAAPGAMPAGDSGMAGMAGMHADTLVDRVNADLAAMAAAGDTVTRLVPAHRQTVEALIADCEAMMRQMNMTPPGKWTTAVSSLRADLDRMGRADAAAVRAMWPAHRERVEGMLAMRHDMMKM